MEGLIERRIFRPEKNAAMRGKISEGGGPNSPTAPAAKVKKDGEIFGG